MDKLMSRRGFMGIVAAFAAMLLTATMAIPAFATTEGSITIGDNTVEATTGAQIDLREVADIDWLPQSNDVHIDYVSNNDSVASINKHSGMLTALEEGTAVITVYLMDAPTPTGNPGKPCNDIDIIDQKTVTVTVDSVENVYGFQGDGGNAVMLQGGYVTGVSGDATNGYTNTLDNYDATMDENGYYTFTFEMTNGFRNYNSVASFLGINDGQINLIANGTTYEATATQGIIFVSSVDSDAKTFTVKVLSQIASQPGAVLQLGPDLRGNNANNSTDCTISFVL